MRFHLLSLMALGVFASCSATEGEPLNQSSNYNDSGVNPVDGSTVIDGDVPVDAPIDTPLPKGPLTAFVGSSDGKIRTYAVDEATGAFAIKRTSNAGNNPSFLAFDTAKKRVVSVDESGGGLVRSFSYDSATGSLTEINNKPAGGAGSTHLSLDPAGKWVFVANYTGGNVSVLPLGTDGMLGNATDTQASGANAHWIGMNPSGTFVFNPCLGINAVVQYSFNTVTGKLTANGSVTLPANSGPRHLAFLPNEKFAYSMNEKAINVTAYSFDKAAGKLTSIQQVSALPAGTNTAGVSGAEIFVHPNGKFVYGSTRSYNSIAVFSVNSADGKLTLLANVPTGANEPRNFGMDPEGSLLYAGNQSSNHIVGFRVNSTTGALTSLGKTVDVAGPGFVGLVRMPL